MVLDWDWRVKGQGNTVQWHFQTTIALHSHSLGGDTDTIRRGFELRTLMITFLFCSVSICFKSALSIFICSMYGTETLWHIPKNDAHKSFLIGYYYLSYFIIIVFFRWTSHYLNTVWSISVLEKSDVKISKLMLFDWLLGVFAFSIFKVGAVKKGKHCTVALLLQNLTYEHVQTLERGTAQRLVSLVFNIS